MIQHTFRGASPASTSSIRAAVAAGVDELVERKFVEAVESHQRALTASTQAPSLGGHGHAHHMVGSAITRCVCACVCACVCVCVCVCVCMCVV